MANKVVVFPELVSDLSKQTNTSEVLCEAFLKEMFSLISERLECGDTVESARLGVFSLSKEGQAQFLPSDDIVSALNAAFDCFEPVELSDEFEDGDIDTVDDKAASGETAPVVEEKAEGRADENGDASANEDASEGGGRMEEEPAEKRAGKILAEPGEAEEERLTESAEMPPADGNPVADGGAALSEMEDFVGEDAPKSGAFRFLWGYLSGFLTAAAIVAVFYWLGIFRYVEIVPGKQDSIAAIPPVADSARESSVDVDTLDALPKETPAPDTARIAAPAGESRTFRVTKQAYLSNISRKFYGHYAFWVYIYLENKDVIKDPDNLPVGVTLTIPDPSKYGIDKNSPASIREAEARAFEVTDGGF